MTELTSWLDDIRALLDDPLSVARDAAASGQLVIGYVGRDVPIELVLASQACPVRLWGLTDTDTSADCYLETAFTPESRSICEQWLCGDLDFIDAVVFPRSNDAAQRLYYYLCELQRCGRTHGPTPLMFDVSTIERSTSFDHTLAATKRLARALQIDVSSLSSSIARFQKRGDVLNKVMESRMTPDALRGSEAFTVLCAADLDWRETFDRQIEQHLGTAPRIVSQRRVLFAGNMPPDSRIHLAVEQSGGNIVRELIEHHHNDLIIGPDILADIARRHHQGATLAQQMLASSTLLVDAAREANAQGVIIWAIEEDETLPWEIPRQAATLRTAGMPVLVLSRQAWRADEAVLAQISEFVASLQPGA